MVLFCLLDAADIYIYEYTRKDVEDDMYPYIYHDGRHVCSRTDSKYDNKVSYEEVMETLKEIIAKMIEYGRGENHSNVT